MTKQESEEQAAKRALARRKRQAEALRANLKRRKAAGEDTPAETPEEK